MFANLNGTQLFYAVEGSGPPLMLVHGGPGLSDHRANTTTHAALADQFRVIALDQRNAGRSRAPIRDDGWATYTADHVALLDHLGIDRCHIMGGCIGSSYCLGLCAAAPGRVSAAVLQNPIGLSADNRDEFRRMFDEWAAEVAPQHPEADAATFAAFRERLFGGDFVFSVSTDYVRTCPVPLLVLPGDDAFHPAATAREIADLAPQAELVPVWRTPDVIDATVRRVRDFLAAHTPGTR